ncbi:hypothetical protein [Halobacterium litoreum]|uniref:Uncharacterized protein n=1 Tax=Halobacterium litoreum TaxID=2039234 RepID=A0ABD5NAF1_9EURY|nr:hypothetical protein [Halobacterium litoreum]UHH14776.1 hypothetical protein LT972_07170 [Halobacterium litoreum]
MFANVGVHLPGHLLLRPVVDTVDAGAGLREGTDAAAGARDARKQMKEDVGAR